MELEVGKVYARVPRTGPNAGDLRLLRFDGGDPTDLRNFTDVGFAPEVLRGEIGPVDLGDISSLGAPRIRQDTTDPANVPGVGAREPTESMRPGDVLRMLVSGLTLGGSDELAGLMSAGRVGADTDLLREADAPLPDRDPFGAAQAARTEIGRVRGEHPVGSLVAEAVGTLPFGGPGAALGRATLRRTGSRVASGAVTGLLGGGATGAAFGALDADPGERAGGAVRGLATGAGAGLLFGAGASAAGQAVRRALGGRAAARTTRDLARADLERALDRAGFTPERALEALGELPGGAVEEGGAVIADLSPSLGREARTAVNRAPDLERPGGPVDRIRTREANANDRISRRLEDAAGLRAREWRPAREAAESARRQVSRELYGPLDDLGPIRGENIDQLLTDPDQFVREAMEFAGVEPGSTPLFSQLQDMRDFARGAAVKTPGANRAVVNKWRSTLQVLDDAIAADVPGVRQADRAYARAVSVLESYQMGRRLGRAGVEEIRDYMETLRSDDARDAFRHGMINRLRRDMTRRTDGGAGLRNSFIDAGESTLEVVEILAKDDESFARLVSDLQAESQMRETFRAVRGNSTTAEQIMDAQAQAVRMRRIPRGITEWIDTMLSTLTVSQDQIRDAQRILGDIYLSQGIEAAEEVAQVLVMRSLSSSLSPVIGAIAAGPASRREEGGR